MIDFPFTDQEMKEITEKKPREWNQEEKRVEDTLLVVGVKRGTSLHEEGPQGGDPHH